MTGKKNLSFFADFFFNKVVPNVEIEINQQYLSNVSNISDPLEKAIKKYQKHPSISIIIQWYQVSKMKLLSFSQVLL